MHPAITIAIINTVNKNKGDTIDGLTALYIFLGVIVFCVILISFLLFLEKRKK